LEITFWIGKLLKEKSKKIVGLIITIIARNEAIFQLIERLLRSSQ